MTEKTAVRGMTLIEALVGTAVMLVVFLSIFAAYQVAIEAVLNSKARVGALSLTQERFEYLRGLPYSSLGTIGGIPSGTLAQVATTSLNTIEYTMRTLIKYVDDPADGLGSADSNLVTADYKELKVETLWTIRSRNYSTSAVTRVAPHGIESLTAGGTLRGNVFDATAAPVSGAIVRIQNATLSPSIDVTAYSDASGSVVFPGAPPGSNYKITITKDGYSTAGTYDVSVANPNPNPGNVSVAHQQTTTASFAIDRLGSLQVRTFSPISAGSFQDTFTNEANISATTSSVVTGGFIKLLDSGAGYALEGSARSTPITPAALAVWNTLSWTKATPQNTELIVQVLGPDLSLIPDSVLPGNSTGLSSPVSLAGVSTTTYPSLSLKASLTTTDASTTPELADWRVDFSAGPAPLPGIGFTLYGAKTIGTTISGAPIYKFVFNETTAPDGTWLFTPLEWDAYTILLSGTSYDIGEHCPFPLTVAPFENKIVNLFLYPHTSHSLRVLITANDIALSGATVTITGPSGGTMPTSACGQSFFSGLNETTYTISVTAPGYQPSVQDAPVSGRSTITIPLTPL